MIKGSHLTEKQRARMSIIKKGCSSWNKGLSLPEEQKKRLSAFHTGLKASPETKAKMSTSHMGKINSLETRVKISIKKMGHIVSTETREKISAAKKGKFGPLSPSWKGGSRVFNAKMNAKRRLMGLVLLNKPFPDSDGHHVDNEQVIHIPHDLHKSISHDHNTGRGMAKINAIAYNYLFKQEVGAAMAAKEIKR